MAIIEHYNYKYYYYTFIASVVLVFAVEIKKNYQTLKLPESNSKSRGGRTVGKRIKIELKFLNGICIQEALRSHTIVNPLGHRKRGVAKLGQEGSGIF